MTCTLDDLRSLVGREFPGGRYTIEPWRAWLTHDAILAPPPGEWAHPAFVFMAATGLMGLRWDELLYLGIITVAYGLSRLTETSSFLFVFAAALGLFRHTPQAPSSN